MTDVPILDLGDRQVPKGTTVTIRTVGGQKVTGTLHGVDYRDGQAHTVTVWDGQRFRQAYAKTLAVRV